MKGQFGGGETLHELLGSTACGTEPQPHSPGSLLMVLPVTFENGLDLVGNPIISRVQQNAVASEFTRQRFRRPASGEAYRRSVAYEGDPVIRYAGVEQATKL